MAERPATYARIPFSFAEKNVASIRSEFSKFQFSSSPIRAYLTSWHPI
jgi:hypothetical protein